ncbi:eCIS core domain-containing protein [Xanthomonas arboricola]|uniref:eCIS core domain-containing protein n=1 Tax=Xanthomonas arboricola TaxID=56448 RepID=UPI000E1F0096|nr:DUF4157 domain-containing protein [Xanthomonas arboricola]
MTIGYNIFVNSGVDKPGSADTIALIAHELEHVFNSKCGIEIFCQITSNSILMGAHLGCLTMRHREIGFEVQGHNAQGVMEYDLLNGRNYCE